MGSILVGYAPGGPNLGLVGLAFIVLVGVIVVASWFRRKG
jgi:hypothetical protein